AGGVFFRHAADGKSRMAQERRPLPAPGCPGEEGRRARQEGRRGMSQALTLPIGIDGIRELLPHRYPFLLVDRVVEFEPGKRVLCIKNVTVNEPFFQGHFPDRPVMPGVLVIEALAQAGGILTNLTRGGRDMEATSYLVKVDGARFSSMVVPGDRLELE